MRGGGGAARPSFRLPRAEGSGCPASCVTDFETAPACILNCGSVLFQFPIHPPPNEFGFLQCSERLLSTMASAQKCMRTIRSDDPSLYVQPHEGPTWAFTARCVGAGMPLHIEQALYFFYSLMAHMELNGVTDFVVPTPTLGLQYDRRCGKRVVGVTRQVESRVRAPAAGVRPAEEEEDASRGFSFQHAARAEHATSGRDTVEMVCPPLVIRLGFTGALCMRPELVSRDPRGMRVKLREQMEIYSYQYKAAATSFQKDAVAVSGKVGGMKDDVCICLQLACYFTQLTSQRAV